MFEKLFEARDISNLDSPSTWLTDLFGGTPTSSGETITEEGALKLSTVYACVNIRANTIAKMPLHIYRSIKDGKEKIKNDISYLLETRPNRHMTPFIFKHTISAHIDLWGNAYVWIETNRKGIPVSLWILNPANTRINLDEKTGKIWYKTIVNDKPCDFEDAEILHFKALSTNGIEGKSRITIARETLGNMKASTKLLGKFYANGTTSKGIITYQEKLGKEAKDSIRSAWQSANSGINNAGKVAILDMGLEYKPIGMNFEDAQFIQLSKFGVEEIARIFSVPLHMINSLDRSTFNNIQQQSLDFISNSIQPTLTDIEEEINYKLFTSVQQKQGYYVKFNMASAMRADDEARAKYYKEMLGMGVYSINDVLQLEDRNNIGELGNKHRISLNYVSLDIADQYQLNKAGGGDNLE